MNLNTSHYVTSTEPDNESNETIKKGMVIIYALPLPQSIYLKECVQSVHNKWSLYEEHQTVAGSVRSERNLGLLSSPNAKCESNCYLIIRLLTRMKCEVQCCHIQ